MRAALYTRLSCADAGVKETDVVASLRRFAAEVRGWQIAAEISDSRPYPDGERPGLVELGRLIRDRRVDVVVTHRLARLVRHLRHFATFSALLLEHEVELVATEDALDTTDPVGRARFLDLARTLAAIDKEQRSEAAKCGHIRATLKGEAEAFGRPLAVVNPLELLGYWHGGGSQPPLSMSSIAGKLQVSESTVRKRLRELREAGRVDDELRSRNLEAAGGLPKGGRPSKARPVDDAELLVLFQGDRPKPLQTIATTYRMSRDKLAEHLDRLEAAGRLDRARRAANMKGKR